MCPFEVPILCPWGQWRGSKIVYVWYECVCAPEFTRAGLQNVRFSQRGFTASFLMTRTVITKAVTQGALCRTVGVCVCVFVYCMSGCDAHGSASSAPVDSHLLPPSSPIQSQTHTSQLSAVNSGDRRKTSYPPWSALLSSITLLRSCESRWG